MLFKKPLSKVEFPDIQKLKDAKIEESEILDYKEQMISDDKLVKHVTAFSNTSGGDLIVGIKESGRGGYPVAIQGIEDNVNKERLEQIIISNIRPRIGVQFHEIDIPNSDRIILIIRIPEGQNRPYYDIRSHKYYKRYNYGAIHMDEFEIESLYQKRFFGASKLAKYVEEIILFHRYRQLDDLPERIDGHIIITPLRIDDRIIDTSKEEQIRINFDPNKIRFKPDSRQQYLQGIVEPSRYGIEWNAWNNNIEAHRNGLVHFVKVYGSFHEGASTKVIEAETLTFDLLQTIQFAEKIYSIYDFMGKVRIILQVINPLNSKIDRGGHFPPHYERAPKCDADEIYIEREWDSWRLTEDYLEIGKNIMDEFSNYYGLWKAGMFDTDGEFILK
ncbi:MAG: Putative DNA-binding domain protein [Candidatus Argoarchaeum ethanivorans]|uniref:DNA-binding domain protein n=1 Tax=Candidatus Argoarchaeum ethanivorans TaxID=2608793 RepID=A0A811TCS1_9EURY|nr:MAG: Putative DNA-binding domain protein [Candidatus Argoarchaeum ethanivorans]